MPRTALTETKIKQLKPKNKPYKVSDGTIGGLHVAVSIAGGKVFYLAYRFEDKWRLLRLGAWPLFTLNEARDLARDAKKQIALGTNPAAARKAEKAKIQADATTFRMVAAQWLRDSNGRDYTRYSEDRHNDRQRTVELVQELQTAGAVEGVISARRRRAQRAMYFFGIVRCFALYCCVRGIGRVVGGLRATGICQQHRHGIRAHRGPATGSERVMRGGSWERGAGYCRSDYPYDYPPTIRSDGAGFRLALSLE